jgi:prolyl oligopeptidase
VKYPPTARGPLVETLHGVQVADPYRWLEDPDSAQTKAWVAAQNAVTGQHLAGMPSRAWFRERLGAILGAARAGVPRNRGGRYLLDRNDGTQDQDVVTVAHDLATLAAGGRVLIDPAEFSADGTASLRGAVLSPDGQWVAYGVSQAGSDWTQWRVRSVESGADRTDVVGYAKFVSAEWLPDSSGFLYWAYPEHDGDGALGAGQLRLHRLGESEQDDEVVYAEPAQPGLTAWPYITEDGGWLILAITLGTEQRSQILARRIHPDRLGPVATVVAERSAWFWPVGASGDVLYLLTDDGAPRRKLVTADLTCLESGCDCDIWADVIAERTDILDQVAMAGDGLLAVYLRDCRHRAVRFDLDGAELGELDLGDAISIEEVQAHAGEKEVFLGIDSLLNRTSVRVDFSTGRSDPLVLTDRTAPPPEVVTERRSAVSKDGTVVPYFLLRRADVTGPAPTMLYGYGGYAAPCRPTFKAAWPAWLAAGGVLAVANLRGGGEFGTEWHEAGTRDRKQNVFDDFIAVGEHLVADEVTGPGQLTIHGRSNGGLLVGAVMTQRPDLAAVALPMVGVLDMLRFHRFTIGAAWIPEAGDPDVAEDFAFLHAYSPLHALRAGTRYPATLILTGDHDDRVVPAHSYKFGAELQHDQAASAPVLLRIETATGHGAGKPATMLAAEFADMLAFAAQHTGLTPGLTPG